MTPSSPTRFRPIARALAAIGCAGALAAAAPAAADAAGSASPGAGAEHAATARIAAVEWCGMGTIGEVETGYGGGPAVAHWDGADDGAGGDQHFRSAPERAYSRVSADGAALSARASITDARLDPSCALLPAADGEPDRRLAEAFGAEDLAAVEAVESRARWTEERGATADLEVRGLEVLGEPVDLEAAGDGAVERTFTADGPAGPVRVDLTARASEHGLSEGGETATAAWAGLTLQFDVTAAGGAEEGAEEEAAADVSGTYRVDLAGAGVHGGRVLTEPSPPEEGGTDPSPRPSPGPERAPRTEPSPEETGGGDRGGERPGEEPGTEGPGGTGDRPTEPGGGAGSTGPGPGGGASPSPSAEPQSPSGESGADGLALDPDASTGGGGGRLPVTGQALIGMAATGLASLAAGAAALYLGRSRSSASGDD
ncbi:hypothetical protein [Nocardiopsis potens]|uniref:hypothetical protein n=1 Tax=Nocardiopsis potens TaxID=1246458 RepID=UPI000475B3FC|nr:hypothetical protein [Nocardiopsis potens]